MTSAIYCYLVSPTEIEGQSHANRSGLNFVGKERQFTVVE